MGKAGGWIYQRRFQGACISCGARFIGPGDRCPPCATLVRIKAAKRRRKR